MFVDTHCHISYEDYDNIDELIMNIKNSKVEKIIVNGTDMKSNLFVLELVRKYDIVYGISNKYIFSLYEQTVPSDSIKNEK